ncbi:MAG: DoxX family protein [Chloroflexota bacterium]
MDYVDIGLWIGQTLLALGMAGAGGMKAMSPREKLLPQMKWVARFPVWAPRAIGLAEVAGAIGLVVPWASGIVPVLTPVAAACLLVLMVGAVKVHVDDDEALHGIAPAVLGALALVVAVGRAVSLS